MISKYQEREREKREIKRTDYERFEYLIVVRLLVERDSFN